jgi:hypothetical protein
MRSLCLVVLLAACTSSPPSPTVAPPDSSELAALYPSATPVVESSLPFAIDLGACAYATHVVSDGRFALAHPTATGECELWIGYTSQLGTHADIYCAFEPTGTASVAEATASTGGGCGGPPGTLPLTVASPRCVAIP